MFQVKAQTQVDEYVDKTLDFIIQLFSLESPKRDSFSLPEMVGCVLWVDDL